MGLAGALALAALGAAGAAGADMVVAGGWLVARGARGARE